VVEISADSATPLLGFDFFSGKVGARAHEGGKIRRDFCWLSTVQP
jgi:hypothetical protein